MRSGRTKVRRERPFQWTCTQSFESAFADFRKSASASRLGRLFIQKNRQVEFLSKFGGNRPGQIHAFCYRNIADRNDGNYIYRAYSGMGSTMASEIDLPDSDLC